MQKDNRDDIMNSQLFDFLMIKFSEQTDFQHLVDENDVIDWEEDVKQDPEGVLLFLSDSRIIIVDFVVYRTSNGAKIWRESVIERFLNSGAHLSRSR